jgi:hypothetical protein
VGRTLTELTVYTFGDFGVPEADERIRIRLYHQDGNFVGNPARRSPSTLIWDSGFVLMKPGWRAQRIAVPNVVVPDRFTWTASFDGITGLPSDRAGLCYFGPPTVGESENWLWRRNDDNSPWTHHSTSWSNGSSAYGSLGISIWADGSPAGDLFSSLMAPTREFLYAPDAEMGDDVVFEGEGRYFSVIGIEYISDATSFQGDEKARVRVYDRDDANPFGRPLNLLYDSGDQPVDATAGGHVFNVFPEKMFPDDVIWTVEFSGVSQEIGDSFALHARTDPSPGASVPTFWFRDAGTLSAFWFGDPTYDPTTWPSMSEGFNNIIGNLSARFESDVPPTFVPFNSPAVLNPGVSFQGSETDMHSSDDVRWVLRPGVVLTSGLPPIVITYEFTLPEDAASSLRFTIESRTSANFISQEVQVWNFVTSAWVVAEKIRGIPFGGAPDLVRTVDLGATQEIIGPDSLVRVRARWKANGPVLFYPWNVGVDHAYLAFRRE